MTQESELAVYLKMKQKLAFKGKSSQQCNIIFRAKGDGARRTMSSA